MAARFPSAGQSAAQAARHPALTVVDIRAEQAAVDETYRNQVLSDVNADCLRRSVFEGEYRWHRHPDSDEQFLVVAGVLEIELADAESQEGIEGAAVIRERFRQVRRPDLDRSRTSCRGERACGGR